MVEAGLEEVVGQPSSTGTMPGESNEVLRRLWRCGEMMPGVNCEVQIVEEDYKDDITKLYIFIIEASIPLYLCWNSAEYLELNNVY